MRWNEKSCSQKTKALGLALLVSPPLAFPFFFIPAIIDPTFVLENFQLSLLFFGVPWAVGLGLLLIARRAGGKV
jgi:hypothetical protein